VDGFGGDGVRGEFSARADDLAAVMALVGEAMPELAARLPELAGGAALGVRLSGTLPFLERIAYAAGTGQELPAPEDRALVALIREEMPVSLDAEFALTDGAVAHLTPSGEPVGASGVEVRGTGRFEAGNLDVEATVRVPRVDYAPSPVPLEGLEAELACRVRDFDELGLSVSRFRGLNGAVAADCVLQAVGLSRLGGAPTPATLLKALDASLTGRGEVRPGALGMPDGPAAEGLLGVELDAALAAGQSLELTARSHVEDLSIAWADAAELREVNGAVQIARTWRIREGDPAPIALSRSVVDREPAAAAGGLRAAVPEFATPGDELAGSPGWLSAGLVTVNGAELLRDLEAELDVSGSAVRLPRLHAAASGGRLVGEASLVPSEGGRLVEASGEFSNVDLRQLFPTGWRESSGDTRVNGDFRLSMRLTPGAQIPLKDLTARVDVTRIGALALDRLLRAVDADGEAPGLSRLRKALTFAAPLRGRATLDRGFASGALELRTLAGGPTVEYALPRFGVMHLFEHEAVAGPVRRAADALRALDVLDADTIVLEPDGGIGLRRAAPPGRMQ
jgi:hypothetical protein